MKNIYYIYISLINILFSIYFIPETLYSGYIQYKIYNAKEKGYGITISLLPYFNSDNYDYKEFYKMIDLIANNECHKNIYDKSKISIKIRQLAKNEDKQWSILKDIVKYANKKNTFVWISTVLPKDIEMEYEYYNKLKMFNYKNIGITLATYHSSVSTKVDNILKNGGHIRLVKGFYYGDISDWNIVTQLYYENALKMIKSNYYHTLASHDFKLLEKINVTNAKNIELSFFYDSLNYVSKYVNNFKNYKSLYIPYGNKLYYLYDNIMFVDIKHIIMRKINFLFHKL